MTNTSPSRLIVLNQTSNPAFDAWLETLSLELGRVELWTGNRQPVTDGRVVIYPAPVYVRTSSISRLRTWLAFTLWAF